MILLRCVIYRRTLKISSMKISLHEFNLVMISNLYDFLKICFKRWESIRAKRRCDNYWIFSLFPFVSRFFPNSGNLSTNRTFETIPNSFFHIYMHHMHIYFLKYNFITISIAIFVFPVSSTNINTRENVLSFLFIARAYMTR